MGKRVMALVLILSFLILSLQGCTNKNTDMANATDDRNTAGADDEQSRDKGSAGVSTTGDKPATAAMGRYMEQRVELPELAANEKIIGILQNSDKQTEVYTSAGRQFLCYRQNTDLSWESSIPGWLNQGDIKSDYLITNLLRGADGNYYVSFESFDGGEAKAHIMKSSDGGKTARKVDLPYFNEATNSSGDYILYPRITKMDVMENGNLVVGDFGSLELLMLFSPEGEMLDEITVGEPQDFKVAGNTIIAVNEERTGILFYDGQSQRIEKTAEYNAKNKSLAFAVKEDGTLLAGDSGGIHRLAKDGTLWEITVDGALNSMSMPSLNLCSLFITEGEREEYYTVYTDNEGTYSLMHYVFDKNVSSVPSREITVYSLQENKTIRQAISLFQAQNDVKVNYVVAMGEEAGNVSDYIRALNTELMAGNGADILVLDGLPVDSYMEKEVLEDISDIINPLEEAGELFTNISESYHDGDKIYRMPIRFTVPVILGKAEAVKNVDSLDSIVNYIAHTGIPYSGSASYRELLENYLALYSDSFLQNKSFDKEQFTVFLQNIKKLADNTGAAEFSEDESGRRKSGNFFNGEDLFIGNDLILVKDDISSSLNKIRNINDIATSLAIIKKAGLEYGTVSRRFLPGGVIGLNHASRDMETAKAFIAYLFTGEVQDSNLYDGFPMNSSSLEKWFATENDNYYIAFGTQDVGMISGGWPTKEERNAFRSMISDIGIPIETDHVLNQMIIEGVLPYLLGDTDIGQTLAAVMEKVNIYLAE
jgi:hypothetical protein